MASFATGAFLTAVRLKETVVDTSCPNLWRSCARMKTVNNPYMTITMFVLTLICSSLRSAEPHPRQFDQPDLDHVVKILEVGGAKITIFPSKPVEQIWQSPRDSTVFTAGTTDSPYFYAQLPSPTGFLLCAQNNYHHLDRSNELRIEVSGLQPDTTYYFRVNDSHEYCRVRTAPKPGTFRPFQFTVAGDSQGPYDAVGDRELNKDRHSLGPADQANLSKNMSFNLTTESMRRHVAPDFSVHVGDIVEDARYTVQWQKELFGQLKYYLTQTPVYLTMGNHEYHDPRCWHYFEMPVPVYERASERAFYSFRWGDALFVVLDFNGHWYRIVDVDDLPSGLYEINDDALSNVKEFVSGMKYDELAKLKGQRLTRQSITTALVSAGLTQREDRAVRAASFVGLPDKARYRIAIRNPRNGRLSLQISADPELISGQWKWLRRELESNKDRKYIFVFGHHQIRYGGVVRQPVVDLCEEFGVTAAFSGHQHVYGHHVSKGVHYFQAGGQSDTVFSNLSDGPQETFVFHRHGPHYIVVTAEGESLTIQGIGRDNTVFEETVISARR